MGFRRRSPLVLLAFALAAAPAHAAFPGRNGKVAYSDNTGEIMVADANGTVDVSNDPAVETMPRWSSDGTRLAWLRMELNSGGGQVPKLIVANADGSGQRQLTVGDTEEGSPSWSPDGRSIAYRSIQPPPTNTEDVYVIKADGTGTPRLVSDSATSGVNYDEPMWSPDGSSIAAIAGQPFGADLGIVLIDPATGVTRQLTSTAGDDVPAWSPDGRTVVFRRGNDLYGVPAGGGAARLIVTPQGVLSGVPFWTPDGTRVGFWDNGGPGTVAYRADGTDPVTIATTWGDLDWQPCSTDCHPLAGLDSPAGSPGAAGSPGTAASPAPRGAIGSPGAPVTALPPPVAGRTANVAPVRGRVLVRLPGKTAFAPLAGAGQIPVGSTVDATAGTVELVSARPGAGTQTADFSQGVFTIRQSTKSARVDVTLSGALACARRARAARKRKHVAATRHLWGDGHGQFRTVGKYSATAVRGTRWLVEDRCDSTLTRVARGVVSVRDFVRNRTVTVPAGHTYTARR